MKRASIALLLLPIFLPFALWAQLGPTSTIAGRLIDADGKSPLVGATVVIAGSEPAIGAVTDLNGSFLLRNVPVGRHTLVFSMLGYVGQSQPNVMVNSGKTTQIELALQEQIGTLAEVELRDELRHHQATNEFAGVSARSFSPEETSRYAGSFNDPARMAASFPGVVADPSGNNDVSVRGNSPSGILWKLEGMEIPNPNHFSDEGASGGAISMLNVNALGTSDFYTAAFPAMLGNASSGVFDLNLRKGNTSKRETVLQLGTLGAEVGTEGPIKGNPLASYLVNYRYSTLAALNQAGINVAGDAVPDFQDAAFKVHVPTQRLGVFTLYGMGGLNRVKETNYDDNDVKRSYYTGTRSMWTSGLKHLYFFGANTSVENHLAFSGNSISEQFDAAWFAPGEPLTLMDESKSVNSYLRLATTLNHKLNAQNRLQVGIISSRMMFDLNSREYDFELGRIVQQQLVQDHTYLHQGFANYQIRPSNSLTLNVGVHGMLLALNKKGSVEPRWNIKWQANPRHSFSIGQGLHSRVENVGLYFTQVPNAQGQASLPNQNLGLGRALHQVLGHQYALSPQWSLKTEAYYQYLYDVPVGTGPDAFVNSLNSATSAAVIAMANGGEGRNYGIETSLERSLHHGFYFMSSNSVFRSQYRNPGGSWADSRYDTRYVCNLVVGKEWGLPSRSNKKKTLEANLRLVTTGGMRYTPLNVEESLAKGYSVYNDEDYLSQKASTYFRPDFSIGIRTDRASSTHTFKIDILNLANNQAKVGEYYDPLTVAKKDAKGIGLLPNILYRIQF